MLIYLYLINFKCKNVCFFYYCSNTIIFVIYCYYFYICVFINNFNPVPTSYQKKSVHFKPCEKRQYKLIFRFLILHICYIFALCKIFLGGWCRSFSNKQQMFSLMQFRLLCLFMLCCCIYILK